MLTMAAPLAGEKLATPTVRVAGGENAAGETLVDPVGENSKAAGEMTVAVGKNEAVPLATSPAVSVANWKVAALEAADPKWDSSSLSDSNTTVSKLRQRRRGRETH